MRPVPPSSQPTVPPQHPTAPSAAAPSSGMRPALRPGLRPTMQPPAQQQQQAAGTAVLGGAAQQKKKPRKAAQWEEQARAAANAAAVALGFPGAMPLCPPLLPRALQSFSSLQQASFLCTRLHRCHVHVCQYCAVFAALCLALSTLNHFLQAIRQGQKLFPNYLAFFSFCNTSTKSYETSCCSLICLGKDIILKTLFRTILRKKNKRKPIVRRTIDLFSQNKV